jgi:hypothetical protein
MLRQVLHEMDSNENFRRGIFKDIHDMLRAGGILIVVENMIPDLFSQELPTVKDHLHFVKVWHKFLEAGLKSKFYDVKGFKEFVATTPFQTVELIEEQDVYFGVLRK